VNEVGSTTGILKGQRRGLEGEPLDYHQSVVGFIPGDSGGRQIYRVEPADFLPIKGDPAVTGFVTNTWFAPNELFPGRDGLLLAVGSDREGRGRTGYSIDAGGNLKALFTYPGRLDGVVQLDDGTLLIMD
jgi:hypothetical protein